MSHNITNADNPPCGAQGCSFMCHTGARFTRSFFVVRRASAHGGDVAALLKMIVWYYVSLRALFSEAIPSRLGDCFVAGAPRNDMGDMRT